MSRKTTSGRGRCFGKVSKKMAEMPIIKVTCGAVKGLLHKNKFYCPGIHRECIEFQGRFITPKTFTVMGEKERLKDWKNAVRINGIQVRKYIESGTLDFNRHDEFCTGRCISRSPVNRSSPLPGSSTSCVPKVEFVSSINEHTYCHLPDDGEHTRLPNIPTVEMRGDPEPVDVKPNVALLQSLLEKPATSTVDVLPPDVHAAFSADKDVDSEPINVDPETAEEDRQFWVGIMELGLLEHFFREIKINLDVYKSDLVTHQVRINDAVRVSSVVRSMGLMNKFKKRLSSFKSDMDQQQAKIDTEMEALKMQVTQYELRKQALKRKSEKFEALMDMSASKKSFIIEKNIDESEDEEDDEEDEEGTNEMVDICYENDEEDDSDDTEVQESVKVEERQEFGEKKITVPPPRPISPVKITTLPSDSNSSYVIKNNSTKRAVTYKVPTSAAAFATAKPDTAKKVTIIRQVLMDTGNDGDAMERLREAAVMKLKQSIAGKQDDVKPTVSLLKPASIVTQTVNSAGDAAVPTISSAPPVKEKIKIIARCKPVTDPAAQAGNIVLTQAAVHQSIPVSSPLTITPTLLSYNPKSHSLSSMVTTEMMQGKEVQKRDSSTYVEMEVKSSKPTASLITKDLKVIVPPVQIKKRKPGPKSKTEYFEVKMTNTNTTKEVVHDDPSKVTVTFENGCQTPIDGVREQQISADKQTVSARRSNRKTTHLFSWGMKGAAEIQSQDNSIEEVDVPLTLDEQFTVEKSLPSDLSPTKETFTWDLE